MKKLLLTLSLFSTFGGMSQLKADCFDSVGCGQVTLGADWLYWKTEQSRMKFGILDNSSIDGLTSTHHQKTLEPKFQTNNGVRGYVGYTTADDAWKVQLSYTYLPGKGDRKETNLGENSFARANTDNFPILNATILSNIHGKWSSKFSQVDLDVEKSISLCETIQIRPHLGLRGIWFKQNFSVSGDLNLGQNDSYQFNAHFKDNLSGIGLEGGLWGNWNIDCGFSLVGHIGGSLLYSKVKDRQKNTQVFVDSISNIYTKDNSHQATPMLDGYIGINYETCIYDRPIEIYVGWEEHVIFDTNPFSFEGGSTLTMQGLTLGGNISF